VRGGGDVPARRSPGALATTLPTQLTSFVGRSEELAAIERLVGRQRLVTLTGSGGCGKTRLAVQVAGTVADDWPDGVWWIDLGPVTAPERVAELAAATLHVMVDPAGGPLRALTQRLRDRRLLVCVDNCEHLLDASAELIDTLLRSCPRVAVLATSRAPLGVAGETVWRVPSMVEREAVSLFVARAAQVRPGFGLHGGNEVAVRTVCRRLDGIPLAIELAAAWLRVLAPSQVAAGLDDRFRLLRGGVRGVVRRHQTLQASVDWSYELLGDDDGWVLRQLAVFAGGFTLDAARAVCVSSPGDDERHVDRDDASDQASDDDVLVALRRLVDASLVVADEVEGQVRYRLLETIREYAGHRLQDAGETESARHRHLDHFLALAETAESELEDADQDAWLSRLETEHDNLRAALDWGLSAPDPERGRRLTAALTLLWLLHGDAQEGSQQLERAIGRVPEDGSTLQARLLVGRALVAAAGGRFDVMSESAERGREMAESNGDDRNLGRCMCLQAYMLGYLDLAGARELAVDARGHAEAVGDAYGVDLSLVLEGLALMNGDRHEEARPVLATAAERCRRRGDRLLGAFAVSGQLEGAQRTGDVRAAERLATEAVRLAEPLGDYFTVGTAISNLAWVRGMGGDVAGGLRLMDRVVRSVEDGARAAYVPTMAVSLGQLHLWNGDLDAARTWFEQALTFGAPLVDNTIVARALPGLATVCALLGEADTARAHVERALALGETLGQPRIVADALDASAAFVVDDDPERAERLLHEALAVRVRHGLRTFYVASLDALAAVAARAEDATHAARLWAASDAARRLMGYPRPPVDGNEHAAAVDAVRRAVGAAAFDAARAQGTALDLDDAVAYATRSRGARRRPASGWASLTPTERRVVDLAVAGLTNPEIAARLFTSRSTVKTHLSHIYTKLDVTNRTELATLAASRAPRA
jgi:predicted ATPase/DNA-binding CsgD family transcriptional regulator